MELAGRFEEFYNAQAVLPQEAKVYVKWTVRRFGIWPYVTVNSIILPSSPRHGLCLINLLYVW